MIDPLVFPLQAACRGLALAASVVVVGCSAPASSRATEPTPPRPTPVAVGDGADTLGGPTQPQEASPPEPSAKPPPWPPCQPQMFDHPAGQHDRFAFEDVDGRFGYRDGEGRTVIAPRYFFAYEFSSQGVAAAMDEQGPVFLDVGGRTIARAFVSDNGPDYFTEGRARVVVDGRVGFIDARGELAVKPSWDFATAFCHGRAMVCRGCTPTPGGEHRGMSGGHWGMIDRRGREVVPPRYDAVSSPFDGERVVFVRDGKPVTLDGDGEPRDE